MLLFKIAVVVSVVSTRSRPKAAEKKQVHTLDVFIVSTRSRPKAADTTSRMGNIASRFQHAAARRRLSRVINITGVSKMFQHAAARRRLSYHASNRLCASLVSTRSRPKAADVCHRHTSYQYHVSTRSRPKAAESNYLRLLLPNMVSTRSRPKAADFFIFSIF